MHEGGKYCVLGGLLKFLHYDKDIGGKTAFPSESHFIEVIQWNFGVTLDKEKVEDIIEKNDNGVFGEAQEELYFLLKENGLTNE